MIIKKILQNFVKSPLKFCLISQILVHSLWHVCFLVRRSSSSQLVHWSKTILAILVGSHPGNILVKFEINQGFRSSHLKQIVDDRQGTTDTD